MVYINNEEHDNPHELPKENLEGSSDTIYTDYTHADFTTKLPEEIEKLEYICHTPNVICMWQQQPHAHFSVAPMTMHMGTNQKAQQSCGSGTNRK